MAVGVGADEAALDNAVWSALHTRHRRWAQRVGDAVGYPADVSPFHAVGAMDEAGWAALAGLVGPRGVAVLFRAEVGPLPGAWDLVWQDQAHQLVLDEPGAVARVAAGAPPEGLRPLGPDDAADMLALVERTKPGPFLARTVELGTYVGLRDGDGRLVAMAGERLALDGYTEVSAVCTHPDAQRRGLGAALTAQVCRNVAAAGHTPFLHVASANERARRVYEALGFRRRRLVDVVVARAPA